MTSETITTYSVSTHDESQTLQVTQDQPMYFPWDNPKNVISQEALHTGYLVIACGFTQILCFLGLPGNILNLIVFAKQGLRDRINVVLFSLTISDTVVVVCLTVYKALCYLELTDKVMALNIDTIMSVSVYYVAYTFAAISQVLVAIISVDRCISVSFPLSANRIVRFEFVVIAVFLTYAFFIGIYVPHLFRFNIIWLTNPSTNQSVVLLEETKFAIENKQALYVIGREVSLLAVKPIGTVIVVTCSVITFVQIKRARLARQDMTKTETSSADAKITKMLLFISAVSVACVIPEIILAYTNIFIPEFDYFKSNHNVYLLVFYIIFMALSVNSSVNFFVYFIMSSKFCATLVSIFPCCRGRLKSRRSKYDARDASTEGTSVYSVNNAETHFVSTE